MAEKKLSPAGWKVVNLLVGNPPQTATELFQTIGVTRTAVIEQLRELMAAGFVERTMMRISTRGRPRHLFSATPAALIFLFANHQQLVVPAMWQALEELGGQELTQKMVQRVAKLIADHYCAQITAEQPRDRLLQFVDLLRGEGVLADIEQRNGTPVLYKRSCPYISMADENQTVCTVDLEMMSQVIGRPVRRTTWRHAGGHCCRVEVDME
ncbi:MAG: helix-turn-helix domain-containing protein [Thermoguttaceae bacterium]|jgi:predicted ArsR family transcriptional regulator